MVQVGYLRKWITDEGVEKVYFKALEAFQYKTLKDLFDNVEDDLKKYLKPTDQHNLFYTVAHHTKGNRKYDSWQAQDIIPFDLDGIDLDRIDEYPKILAKALDINLDKTAIVHSGNGCHILVQVPLWRDKSFIKKARLGYRQLLDRVVAACEVEDLPIDKDTTAWDYARVLRVPFTKNVKQKKDPETGEVKEVIKVCTLIQNKLDEQVFQVPILEAPRDKFHLTKGSWPKPDQETIVSECSFFKWLKEEPAEVHEPHAYAMLSITGHFDDDNKTSSDYWHTFSSPSINSKDLAEFTEQALSASGPRTCEGINDIWGKCETCPHYNKVTSPIMLKDPNYIGTEHLGFTLIGSKGTKIRQYEDLVRYFEREKVYRHVVATGQLFLYEDGYFQEIKDGHVKNFALEHFTSPTKATERLEFLNYVKDWRRDSVDFLHGKENEGLINFANGVLDIKTKTLLPHSPDYGFFYKLPYKYDPTAKCPTWDKFLNDVTLNREELKNILEEFLGFTLRGGRYKYHKALILSGDGKNGKSTFNDVLGALVGDDNIASTSLVSMGTSPFAVSDLHGKLVNISEEEPPHCFKETGIFKNITGENKVSAQKKFKDSFKMINKAKVVITYNEMPFISDTSTGMKRRLLIVPFDLDLEHGPKKANANIIELLLSELSGIANKAIEGYERLEAQDGFTKSSIVDAEVREVIEDSNPFFAWYDETVQKEDDGSFVKIKDAFSHYENFMSEFSQKAPTLGIRKFSKNLKQKGFKVVQRRINGTNYKCYLNMALRKSDSTLRF
jgi:P4 family phage/plasmid primase-like protien